MNNQPDQQLAGANGKARRKSRALAGLFVFALLGLAHGHIFAQLAETGTPEDNPSNPPAQPVVEDGDDASPQPVVVFLPDIGQMALALSDDQTRQQALLDIAVAAHVLDLAGGDVDAALTAGVNHEPLVQGFLDNRAWLQRLVDRYGWKAPGVSVLDPAAWLVLGELQQHELLDASLVLPGHMPGRILKDLVFQRSYERFAAANLAAYLQQLEVDAVSVWRQFLQIAKLEDGVDPAWKPVEEAWFADRRFDSSGAVVLGEDDMEVTPGVIMAALSRQVFSAVDAAPPDRSALQRLRYGILRNMTEAEEGDNGVLETQKRLAFYLSGLIDGLHEGRYFDFVQGLLTITTQLLELPEVPQESLWLVGWLVEELPEISAHYAAGFAAVDTRLNAAMEAAFNVLQRISNLQSFYPGNSVAEQEVGTEQSESGADTETGVPTDTVLDSERRRQHITASRARLADASAQLALMIPDMGYYFDTPVRQQIVEQMNICISIAASRDEAGNRIMLRRQFDGCMDTFLQMADQDTRSAELAGNVNGPFTLDTLGRELSVTPWQRINYGVGYLHHSYPTDCPAPANPLPNPLEFAVLATTMSWFAGNAPEFAATPENEARMARMRDIGEQLVLGLTTQVECFAGSASAISDPVSRGMTDYELALRELNNGIKNAEMDFRSQRLSPGADVLLEQDATQRTSYRPDDLTIGPCDEVSVCEMTGELSTTRALIGLFPNEYLLAEQTGLGEIEMCYRNLGWVKRRSELVRADDENVSNYYGHLGFDLVGRFSQGGNVSDIFAFRFISPEEHHYLFAQTSEEVLEDGCPMSWVGSKIITPLREERFGIVPDRLTYLAASRMLPSRLLQGNWDRGAEWRDWFVTGIGVTAMAVSEAPDIMTPLSQHLDSLYQAEQAEIYRRILLADNESLLGEDVSMFDEIQQLSITKALLRMQMMLFYPGSLVNSDKIRIAIAGDEGLLDNRLLRRFRQENVPMTTVNAIALERLNMLRNHWNEQPEMLRRKGSVSISLMNAMVRVNAIYRRLFVERPEPLKEMEPGADPADQATGTPSAGLQEGA
jgi:hypothetical protein